MARVGAEGEPQKQQAVRQTRPTNTPRRIAVISVCALVVIAAVIVLLVLFIPGQATNTDDGELDWCVRRVKCTKNSAASVGTQGSGNSFYS